ncbi:DEAD/DEAH box helicase [Simplicispira psychrophila]|uniref:DEAD/DEAH box helicase n=1 Tax=Simplicispira psychrophila TaxID=80882 RepID=UPI000A033C71|nr:DEAD/DEAH box helicase [Simplicispira psychrophila]
MNARLFTDAAPDYTAATFPPPRPFQQSAHEALRQGFREGHRCQVIASSTGSGKTYLGLRVAHEALLKGRRVTFLCDRTTLINQTSAAANAYGLSAHGIVQANHPQRDSSLPFQIASVQTIDKREFWPQTDVLIVDECHTLHKAWVEFAAQTKAVVIGLTATPFTKGMGQIFSRLINATTMHDLTESGVLVPLRVLSCTRPDMAGAAVTKGGEWSDKAAEERGMGIVGDVVKEWQLHASDRKTIVFGASIAHSKALCAQFIEAGILARVFTSETPAHEREELVREFAKPDAMLRVLVSVEALAKGFDVPDVGCVVDARPLRKSLSTFIQMIGRGLRCSPATGKTDCLLLDHSGNIVRFADDFERIYHDGVESLDDGAKLDKTVRKDEPGEYESKACPSCGHAPFSKRCMSCGFEKPVVAVEVSAAGVMREITIGKGKSRKVLDNDPAHLWAQLCGYAKANSAPDKQQWRARFLFRDIAGDWPPEAWHIATTPDVPVSAALKRKIRSMVIAHARAKGRA